MCQTTNHCYGLEVNSVFFNVVSWCDTNWKSKAAPTFCFEDESLNRVVTFVFRKIPTYILLI